MILLETYNISNQSFSVSLSLFLTLICHYYYFNTKSFLYFSLFVIILVRSCRGVIRDVGVSTEKRVQSFVCLAITLSIIWIVRAVYLLPCSCCIQFFRNSFYTSLSVYILTLYCWIPQERLSVFSQYACSWFSLAQNMNMYDLAYLQQSECISATVGKAHAAVRNTNKYDGSLHRLATSPIFQGIAFLGPYLQHSNILTFQCQHTVALVYHHAPPNCAESSTSLYQQNAWSTFGQPITNNLANMAIGFNCIISNSTRNQTLPHLLL